MAYMGEESKKEWICITDPLCCIAETNTFVNQLYSNKKKSLRNKSKVHLRLKQYY